MTDTFTMWALVPNLLRVMQTEKAVLFNREETNEDLWIPKSQIYPEVEAASSCFVGLSLWIVKKRGLRSFALFNSRDFSLDFLYKQEEFYFREKGRATLTKEERMAEVQALLSPMVAARLERLLLPGEEIEEAKERLPLKIQGEETKRRLGLEKTKSTAEKARDFMPSFFPDSQREYIPKPFKNPTPVKKTRAMNLHFDDEE